MAQGGVQALERAKPVSGGAGAGDAAVEGGTGGPPASAVGKWR
jgi:hypothetical protein